MQDSSALDVHTEVFEGPLDLLLYLIKKDNLDIYDIPIAQITQEYLAYLDVMKELNLDTAGEFLLMAATLMQIKVRLLLPSQENTEQEQGPDPRVELAAKLAEYEKYKAAALLFDAKYDANKDIFYRGSPKFAESDKVLNLELFDLLAAVKRAFDTVEDDGRTISSELFPIETRIEKIATLLREREWILLDDVFRGEKKRLGIITCFMALLEMIKQRKVFARQDAQFGEIRVYLNNEPPAAEQAGQQPPQTQEAPPQEAAPQAQEPASVENAAPQAPEPPTAEQDGQPAAETPVLEQNGAQETQAEPPLQAEGAQEPPAGIAAEPAAEEEPLQPEPETAAPAPETPAEDAAQAPDAAVGQPTREEPKTEPPQGEQ